MNELSWLIYLAGVSGNIGGVMIAVAVVSGVVSAGCLVASGAIRIEAWDDEEKRKSTQVLAASKKPIVICVAASIMAALIPSSETVYAIAASEMGERVIKSETGGKAVEALNAWLDRQVSGADKKQVDPA